MKTTSASLESLFDAFADQLSSILKDGKKVVDKETGEVISLTPDASTLGVVRQFLRDNNVSAVPGTNEKINDLAASLPFGGQEFDDRDYPN
jgi:hypothetical protein